MALAWHVKTLNEPNDYELYDGLKQGITANLEKVQVIELVSAMLAQIFCLFLNRSDDTPAIEPPLLLLPVPSMVPYFWVDEIASIKMSEEWEKSKVVLKWMRGKRSECIDVYEVYYKEVRKSNAPLYHPLDALSEEDFQATMKTNLYELAPAQNCTDIVGEDDIVCLVKLPLNDSSKNYHFMIRARNKMGGGKLYSIQTTFCLKDHRTRISLEKEVTDNRTKLNDAMRSMVTDQLKGLKLLSNEDLQGLLLEAGLSNDESDLTNDEMLDKACKLISEDPASWEVERLREYLNCKDNAVGQDKLVADARRAMEVESENADLIAMGYEERAAKRQRQEMATEKRVLRSGLNFEIPVIWTPRKLR